MANVSPSPLLVGAVTGFLSAMGLAYYASKAISPGILGMVPITVIAVLFGVFIGLSSATLYMLAGFRKFFTGSGCAGCGNEIPGNANFCPHCGKRPVYLAWEINDFHARHGKI
ncbi:MAG: zinc ribbon domain-containing protein [Candidatus Aenigmarchaeota archaeon]|nr:zinc ribbon domain-containing protein [Candidatus Aenigmarchaeota archaeon]